MNYWLDTLAYAKHLEATGCFDRRTAEAYAEALGRYAITDTPDSVRYVEHLVAAGIDPKLAERHAAATWEIVLPALTKGETIKQGRHAGR